MMEEQNKPQPPQKTAVAPQKTAVAPQKTAVAPQKTAVAPQKTAVAPQKTAVAPQKTAVAPQKTAVADQTVAAGGQLPPADVQVGGSITVGGKNYNIEKQIGSGSEGNVYIVNDGKRRYALKMCNPDFHTNMKVMPTLQQLNDQHVLVEIVDFADDFELLEFVSGGSAASVDLKGNAQAITAIAIKTALALDTMHKAGVIHKDVKPANILLRDTTSWDSVLCDFGIADVLTERGSVNTEPTRTIVYAAPEMYDEDNITTNPADGKRYCELTDKADFYSLGMTILSLWLGEEKFLQQEQELAMDKKKGRITIPDDMPNPLNKICRGLLICKPDKRWGMKEITAVLEGEELTVDEADLIPDLKITFNAAQHLVANTPKELADCMSQDRELAIRYLYKGDVEKWLQNLYPKLAFAIHDIVEERFKKDNELGYFAAIMALDSTYPFTLSGFSRTTGEKMERDCVELTDISNFCNEALLDDESKADIESDIFKEWVRVRNADKVRSIELIETDEAGFAVPYMHIIQTIDPLSDINLINDRNHPDYAMTGEALGRFLNQIYNIFWNICEGDITKVRTVWERKEHAPLNRQISADVIINVAASIIDRDEYKFLHNFFATKGSHFSNQESWYYLCTDDQANDFQEKLGPKDDNYFVQISWMRIIKGYGATPTYLFTDSGKTVTTAKEALSESKKTLKYEYETKGLQGFLAVCHQEDPTVNMKPQFTYEQLLADYVEDLAKIDPDMDIVQRYCEAKEEAARLLSEGKGKIRKLVAFNVLQYVLTMLLAVLPGLLLLLMLVLSIIEHPLVDTESLNLKSYIWIVGLLFGLGIWINSLKDDEENIGCLASLIAGGIVAGILYVLVLFLGKFVLYFYVVIVLAVLGFFSWKTVFSPSKYARRARKFTKPGFDEKVLEPLDYAFGDDDEFDSSLNGAFNDHELGQWKGDLKVRGIFVLIFIVVMWVLMSFSLLIPQSERFSRFSAPFVEFFGFTPAAEAEAELPPLLQQTLKRGDQGDAVRTLQQFLLDRGLTRNKPDGDYGRGTEKVVKAFQQANGLEATGAVDEATLAAINKIAATVAAAEAADNAAAEENPKVKETTKPKAKETTQPKTTETAQPAASETAQPKAKPAAQPQREESSQPAAAPAAPASSGEKSVSLDQLMKMSEKKTESSNP